MNPDRTICRICRSSDGLLLDIFGSVAQKVTYFEDIDTCLSLKVGKDDGLPQVICVKCAGKLSECTPYVNKVRLLHSQHKLKRSGSFSDICSHCGENGNYLFEIPQESLSKVETCFKLQVPDKEHICHRCQFHLETLYELHVKSRDTQQNFLNKKSPWQEACNQPEETVSSMVKSLSKKFLSKMKKGKSSSRASNIRSVKSISDESCSEVSSTVRNESSDSSDEDLPLASLVGSSSLSKKEAVISNLEPSKLKRRSSSENGNHDTDSEISLKRSKQSAHPKHRRYEDNQDALQERSPKSSSTKLVVSEKKDAQVSNNSSFDGGTLKKKSHKATPRIMMLGKHTKKSHKATTGMMTLGKHTHSGMNNSRDSSFSKNADTEHGTSSQGTDSAIRLPQNKNARISLIDVCKCLGADFFSKGPVSATEFSKLMSSNAPTKRVHWAKDVGDFVMSRRGKRVQLSAESKTVVIKETEHAEKISAPAHKRGSQRSEHKSSKSSYNQKKSAKPSEGLKKKKSTQEEAKDNTEKDEGTTSTNDHVQLSEDKENENPPRSKPRRSASKITSYKDMFDDDNFDGDKENDDSEFEVEKNSSKNDRIEKSHPPYLKNVDMGDTPKKMYKPFICPMCHAGYISTVKGLLHKLMEHDPRSNFTVRLTRCDSDETFTSTSRQNHSKDDALDVTPPKKRKKLSEPSIEEKSPGRRAGRPRKHVIVSDQEGIDSPEAAIPAIADNSLSIASINSDATNSSKTLETDNNASKTIQGLENDSLVAVDNVVNGEKVPATSAETHVNDPDGNVGNGGKVPAISAETHVNDPDDNVDNGDEVPAISAETHVNKSDDNVDNGEKVPAISAETHVNNPDDNGRDDAEVSDEENNCTGEAHATKQVDDLDTLSEEKRSEIVEKSPEEKSLVKDSNSQNTLDNDKLADERSKEAQESVAKPCVASEKPIKRITLEDTSEVSDPLTISVSEENDNNSEDGTDEKNLEGNSIIPTEKDSDKDSEVVVTSNTDTQGNADEAPADDENEASVEHTDEDSMKDADEDNNDDDSVKGANEDDLEDTKEDLVKGAGGEDSVKIADEDSASYSPKDSPKDGGDDSEKSGDEDSGDSQTLKESVNESCAGDGKTLEDGAKKVIEAAGTDTSVERADETSEDDIDQTSVESAKKSLEDTVDEVTEEVSKQVPEKLFGRDIDALNAC